MTSSATDSELVRKALFMAITAHDGQHDRGGKPYILHPITVSMGVEGELAKAVALLHDVVEDTDVTIDQIRSEFGDEVADRVFLMTHEESMSYEQYVRRLSSDPVCRRVKLSDLAHNMDPARLHNPGPKDYERLEKYERAKRFLLAAEEGTDIEDYGRQI